MITKIWLAPQDEEVLQSRLMCYTCFCSGRGYQPAALWARDNNQRSSGAPFEYLLCERCAQLHGFSMPLFYSQVGGIETMRVTNRHLG